MKKPVPILRGDHYYLRRRVPARYAPVDQRTFVQICLFTDSLVIAERKAAEVWAQMVDAWEAKLDGATDEADARMAAARNLAQRRGYRYLGAPEVARLPIEELLQRIESVVDKRGRLDMREADAALGLAPAPAMTVSQAFEEFYKVAGDRIVGKSADQMRRHKAPRLKATNNFIAAVGNKQLAEITTDDMFAFRAAWLERVARGEVKAESANKDFIYLGAMWKAVAQAKGIPLRFDTEGLALSASKGKKATRPPFSDEWIKDKLLAPGALDGLNIEARTILLVMINTGARPSEIAGLQPDEIRLAGKVPHILIQPNATRHLKNRHSERYIPLTGVSLEAIKAMPAGFPAYAQKSATLSATVNKFLAENNLLETDDHSMYSLRHAFEDRMLTAGIDERIRRDLLGHGLKRERYGKGGDMEHVHGLLAAIAL
ncbi:tyrosine-type recombinase/integrase [Paracoccus yeei]|uniref:Integrase n=1 Tax=Paracoccus yeei TaxID=147645 RepID=A0A2D2BWD4_9RHOB|nr:tyrosine-type recombinase/integrase [Paracoccus yeei]ATQ54504.1 integrase [Paracoccus yeei]